MHSVIIKVYHCSGTYSIEGKGTRPVGWSVVLRRKRRGTTDKFRTTRKMIIDRGAASAHTAHGVATRMALREEDAVIEKVSVDLGDLGTFADSDAGRDAYLAAVRERM